jgi:hypothetical protein
MNYLSLFAFIIVCRNANSSNLDIFESEISSRLRGISFAKYTRFSFILSNSVKSLEVAL